MEKHFDLTAMAKQNPEYIARSNYLESSQYPSDLEQFGIDYSAMFVHELSEPRDGSPKTYPAAKLEYWSGNGPRVREGSLEDKYKDIFASHGTYEAAFSHTITALLSQIEHTPAAVAGSSDGYNTSLRVAWNEAGEAYFLVERSGMAGAGRMMHSNNIPRTASALAITQSLGRDGIGFSSVNSNDLLKALAYSRDEDMPRDTKLKALKLVQDIEKHPHKYANSAIKADLFDRTDKESRLAPKSKGLLGRIALKLSGK